MSVRLAEERDFQTILEMGRHNAETTKPGEPYEDDRVRGTFDSFLETADPTFFVEERDGVVRGFLIAGWGDYEYRSGFYTVQRVLYVAPEHRGTRAAVSLMKHLIEWSRNMNAVEVMGGNDNGFQSDRTADFLGHFGFKKVGYTMALTLENPDGR